MDPKIAHLRELYLHHTILFVEDNRGLRENIVKILKTICPKVHAAENGESALSYFIQNKVSVVITDIHMPGMDWTEMIVNMKLLEPSTRIIILSAHDEKEQLHQAIDLHVFAYLLKPTQLHQVLHTLEQAAVSIKNEENQLILHTLLHDVFHYQNNLLLMFEGEKPVLANQRFLDFIGVDTFNQLLLPEMVLDTLLLEHDNFLFSTPEKSWLQETFENPGKLFHTKMERHDGEYRHLIMKARTIPEKEAYTILSFDDVTELQLMAIFDSKTHAADKRLKESKTIISLFKIIHDNAAEVKIFNVYKGLPIIHAAAIINIEENRITLKSLYSQLKIVQLVKTMLITSEIFPQAVLVKSISSLNFDEQTISFEQMEFVSESIDQRANIRLEPDPKHTITLFFQGHKVAGDLRIVDLSICSLKVELMALPAGITVGDDIDINMVLSTNNLPSIIHTRGKLYRIDETKRSYYLIVLFELHGIDYKALTNYMSERQMNLIREFKSQ